MHGTKFLGVILTDKLKWNKHLPIFIISDTEIKRTTEARSVQTREMGANNILNLQKKLQDFDWSSVNSFNDASLAYEHFLSIFKRIFDECCPVRIKKIKHHFRKQWMTPALLKSSQIKDKLYKKFQKNPTAGNKLNYNSYKNIFTKLRRAAEKDHLHNKFERAQGNLKETWKIIKEVINKKQQHLSTSDSFKHNGKLIKDPEYISNKFNEFFVTIGPNLDAKIDPPQ